MAVDDQQVTGVSSMKEYKDAFTPMEERNTPSSSAAREALLVAAEHQSHSALHPVPPLGPPPAFMLNVTSGPSNAMTWATEDKPSLVSPCKILETQSRDREDGFFNFPHYGSSDVSSIRDPEATLKAEDDINWEHRKIDEIVSDQAQSAFLGSALDESKKVIRAKEVPTSAEEVSHLSLEKPELPSHHRRCGGECFSDDAENGTYQQNAAQMRSSMTTENHGHESSNKDEMKCIVSNMEAYTQARTQSDMGLRIHDTTREAQLGVREQRKAKRVANVRNLAELARASTETDDSERKEIQRALAAVDETRRKRVECRRNGKESTCENSERIRRRQIKREALSKKRKDMEVRLEEEANKMAQLTESAKKKGESKFMSEEAKRDAQERIQAEVELVAQLERHAAEMARQREMLQRQIEQHDDVKVAEIEAGASALKAKREEMEARVRQEEIELETLSESARREAENNIMTETVAIAEMERKALELSAKRAEIEEQMRENYQQENFFLQETTKLSEKRVIMEDREMDGLVGENTKRAMHAATELLNSHPTRPRTPSGSLHQGRRRTFNDYAIREDHSHLDDVCSTHALPGDAENVLEPSSAVVASRHTFLPPGNIETEDIPESQENSQHSHPGRLPKCELSPDGNHDHTQMMHAEVVPEEMGHLNQDVTTEKMLHPFPCVQCHMHEDNMSPAHLAAAAGHIHCLEAINIRDPEQATKVDSSGRCPLFYACAAARAETTELLIREGPHCCHMIDTNEDTPLHAAALAGSALCCYLLLEQGHVEVNPRNSFCMTPAHLASNNDVLEVLSYHGADLNAKDLDSRTPLFMACASDRLEKAEFLCELLEYAGQDLGEADKRGDTPIHAAACNGSTACLLLLLQYGVAPDVRNAKGLRAIDLATRKGQTTCEKILLEYQLHHQVDDSYFDSVLFLATLEGHRKCREVLHFQEQREHTATHAASSGSSARTESPQSLRSGRSLLLRHYGDWIAYEDQNDRTVFWYNHVAQTWQWETPPGVCETSTKHRDNASMRLKKQGDLIEYTLPDGNVFYYNDRTNEFQWQRPGEGSPRRLSDEQIDKQSEVIATGVTWQENGDWGAFKDPSTGLVFWFNHVTGKSRWEPPENIRPTINLPLEEEITNDERDGITGEK